MTDLATWQPPFSAGERFSRELLFDSASVMAFSRAALDPNPLHLDRDLAARSRFGGLIASGTQSMSWLMGFLGTFVTERCASLGLACDFKLRRAVLADRVAIATWEVVSLTLKPSLNGYVMTMTGALSDQAGAVLVAANASILIMPEIPPSAPAG